MSKQSNHAKMIADLTLAAFIAFMVISVLWAAAGRADDLRAVPIIEGTPAPFGGMLMTLDLATELGVKVERCEKTKSLELEYRKKLCALDNEKLMTLSGIRERALEAKLKVALEALDEQKVNFYEEPVFNVAVGVIGGVALTVTGIWALSLLREATLPR